MNTACEIPTLSRGINSHLEVGHIIYGDSAKEVGHVDRGIVFAVNPTLSQYHKASMGVFPLDYIVTQDWGYLFGSKVGAPDLGVTFRQMMNTLRLQFNKAKMDLIQQAFSQAKPENILYAESITLLPMEMARQTQGVFKGIPDEAFDVDYLHLIKDTSIGCAIAAARYSGVNAVVISGLDRLFAAANPKPALKLVQWFGKVQPRWLFSFSPCAQMPDVRLYVHPAKQPLPDGATKVRKS